MNVYTKELTTNHAEWRVSKGRFHVGNIASKKKLPKGIEQRGDHSYRITVCDGYNPDGTKRRAKKTLNFPESMSQSACLRECEKERAILIAELQRGEAVISSQITLRELAGQYLEDHATAAALSEATKAGYRLLLEGRILPVLGNQIVQKITPKTISGFYTKLYRTEAMGNHTDGKTLSASTVMHYHRLLRAMLNYAVKCGYIATNPVERVTPPKVEHKEMSFYTDEQCAALLNALEDAPLKYRVGVMLGLLGQLRKGEIAGLDWDDVDFERRLLHVRRSASYVQGRGVVVKEPKTASGRRTIALPADLLEAMRTLRREQAVDRLQLGETWQNSGAMFTAWNGARQHPDTIGKWFSGFLKAHDLPHIRFHDLRHTGASLLFAQGVDVQTISKRLGHSKTSVTMDIYGHAYNEYDRSAADELSASLMRKRG